MPPEIFNRVENFVRGFRKAFAPLSRENIVNPPFPPDENRGVAQYQDLPPASRGALKAATRAYVDSIIAQQEEYPHPLGEVFKLAQKNNGIVPLETALAVTPDTFRDATSFVVTHIMHVSEEGNDVIVDPFYQD